VRSLSGGHLARLGAQRAIGQLKAARTLSTAAGKSKTTTTDAASTLASNAFDSGAIGGGGTTDGGAGTGGSTSGGGTSGAGGGGGGTIDPGTLGSGSATDVTAPTGSGVNATPYQQALDAIHQMAQKAAQMKSTGMMLLIAGAILVGIGAWMMTTVWGAVYGAVLVGIGSLIIGMGAMMMMMAGQLASQAKQMASQIEQQYGQSDTSQALQQCVDQALNNPQQQNCDKAKNVDPNSSATQQQVNQESQSGYTVGTEDGQPMGNTGGGQSQGQSQQKALGAGH
ncbi:MAG: hypothetical protein KGK30_09500, partial [Elusimicrobia bacterium]|nr:hypothetical protein [Elusimicrobiota bacterium]